MIDGDRRPLYDRWLAMWNGRIAEYWVSSDGVHLMAQLGMLPASP